LAGSPPGHHRVLTEATTTTTHTAPPTRANGWGWSWTTRCAESVRLSPPPACYNFTSGWVGMIVHKTTNAAAARKTSLVMAFLLLPLSAFTMHFYCKPSQNSRFSRFLFPPSPDDLGGLGKRIKALDQKP
jgi:hypothetical protein